LFEQMKSMGALAGLLRNKEKLQQISEDARARIDAIHVEGEAGSGAVRVRANGRMQIDDVILDPALVAGLGAEEGEGGRNMAQSLIAEATNNALRAAQLRVQTELQELAREHDLPDIPGGGIGNLLGQA
jgi:nucleoid-associated protein EbfC